MDTGVTYGFHVDAIRRAREAQQRSAANLRKLRAKKQQLAAAEKAKRTTDQERRKFTQLLQKEMKDRSADIKGKDVIRSSRAKRGVAKALYDIADNHVEALEAKIGELETTLNGMPDSEDPSVEQLALGKELFALQGKHAAAMQTRIVKHHAWEASEHAVKKAEQLYLNEHPADDDMYE